MLALYGHPFSSYSRVETTFVDGVVLPVIADPRKILVATVR